MRKKRALCSMLNLNWVKRNETSIDRNSIYSWNIIKLSYAHAANDLWNKIHTYTYTHHSSNEWSQKVCTKWWKISRLGFWVDTVNGRESESEKKIATNEYECDQEKLFILFYFYGSYLFMPHLFLVPFFWYCCCCYYRCWLLRYFLGFHSLLFTSIFSCTCNKTNVSKGGKKTQKNMQSIYRKKSTEFKP